MSAERAQGRRGKPRLPRGGGSQRGYLMVGLVAAVAIMMIFSTLAFQAWVDLVRRDNEAEMMFRARDLVRAIQRYRRDHGGQGPRRLEELMEPGPLGQYYLRKLWKDPLVPDGKWGLIYAGPGGQLIDPNATETGLPGAGTAVPGGGPAGLGGPGSGTTGSAGGPPGAGGAVTGTTGGTGPFGGQQTGSGAFGGPQAGDDPNAGGRQIVGLPIAGVRTLCDEEPFRVYNGLTEYDQWLFTYLDLERPQLPGGVKPPTANPTGFSSPDKFKK